MGYVGAAFSGYGFRREKKGEAAPEGEHLLEPTEEGTSH